MNPVVVIASHERISITRQNIQSLLNQSVVPKIVLVVSKSSEQAMWKKEFPQVHVRRIENNPLGKKWQYGAYAAQLLEADPMIITGSDDILGIDFVKNACELSGKFDFIGLFQWHVLHEDTLYTFNYNAKIPLGGGRVYSKKLLDRMNWKVFDTGRNKHLDDLGFHRARALTKAMLEVRDIQSHGLPIVSVKGPWVMMNKFKVMLNHRNCTLKSKVDGAEVNTLIGFRPTV